MIARRPVSRVERRVTLWLKVVLLIAVSIIVFGNVLTFLDRIHSVAIILVGAVFFSYLIYPVVRRLNGRMALGWAILIVYAFIAMVLVFGFSFVLPPLIDNSRQLILDMPTIVKNASTWIAEPNNPFLHRLPHSIRDYLAKTPEQISQLGTKYASTAATSAFTILLSTVSLAATFIVIPVLAAYMMLESESLKRGAIAIIPLSIRPRTLSVLADMEKVLGGFIRGQVTVGATIGALITIMLLIMHVKYAVLIGVAAGVLDVIPYVGAVAAFIPAVTLAVFQDGVSFQSMQHAGLVALLFIVIFQMEGHFIAPKIVSDSVGLTPLWVIIAILIGGEVLGIVGMFIAVPIAGMIHVLIKDVVPSKTIPGQTQPELTPEPRDERPAAPARPSTKPAAPRRA